MKTPEEYDFRPIPINEIDELAKKIAIEWCENYTPYGSVMPEIAQKQKLASDIIHYSRIKTADLQAEIAALKAERDKLKDDVDILNIMLHDTLNPSPPNEEKEQPQPPEQ